MDIEKVTIKEVFADIPREIILGVAEGKLSLTLEYKSAGKTLNDDLKYDDIVRPHIVITPVTKKGE